MKNKNVQIPYELFLLLLQYHLMEYRQNEEKIRQGLEKKMNAWQKEKYTADTKLHLRKKNEKNIGKNILDREEYQRLSMVTSLLMVL